MKKKYRVEKPDHVFGSAGTKIDTLEISRETKSYIWITQRHPRIATWEKKEWKSHELFSYFDTHSDALDFLLKSAESIVKLSEKRLDRAKRDFEKIKNEHCMQDTKCK